MSNWPAMLTDLLDDDSDTMSAREDEFIESIDKQRGMVDDWTPSYKQLAVLEAIWRKVFG